MQGVGNTTITYAAPSATGNTTTTITYKNVMQSGRTYSQQAGYQVVGWLLSVGIGAVAGLLIGLIYRCINDQE